MSDPYQLYTPAQKRIYNAVAGAVMNARDGHPSWPFSEVMARSIAKRATGTLLSQWQDVLAALLSDMEASASAGASSPCDGERLHSSWRRRRKAKGSGAAKGVLLIGGTKRRSPLRVLHEQIGTMVATAKREGQTERTDALVDVLRLIAELRDNSAPPSRPSGPKPSQGS